MSSRTAQIQLVRFHPEVYEPCDDSFALVDALLADGKSDPVSAKIMHGDINQDAAEAIRAMLEAHGLHAEIIITDIASGLQKRFPGMVDVVVVNPPQVPTLEKDVGCEGITASLTGSFQSSTNLYVVTLTANNPSQMYLLMKQKGYASWIILQRSTEEESLRVIKFWQNIVSDQSDGSNS